jgi:ribose 5-phosphate isomerase B
MYPTIYIGTDHGGFAKKEVIKQQLMNSGYQVIDCGAATYIADDDYPPFAIAVAKNVAADIAAGNNSFGILLCRSGIGMAVVANKIPGIRAATLRSVEEAQLGRMHNDINVISLPADVLSDEEIWVILKSFLNTQFLQEERHVRRVKQIKDFEQGS